MTTDHVAEILRAAGTLRSGDPAGVSAIVQNALALAGLSGLEGTAASGNPACEIRTPRPALPHREGVALPRLHAERLRKPLGEVVRTLQAGGKGLKLDGLPGLGRPANTPELPLPEGARFLDQHYSCAAGARRYRLYVPSTADEGLQGLVVMLHGCTQSPEDFAAGTGMNALAEEHRLLVVYPGQTGGDNAMFCWNWFRPGDQRRDAGEPAIIAGLTTSLTVLTDGPHAFVRPGDAVLSRRVTPDTAALPRARLRYLPPDPKLVNLSFAGRLRSGEASLAAISSARPGDPVRLIRDGDRWRIDNDQGQTLARLSRAFAPPEGTTFLRGEVAAVLNWRRQDGDDGRRQLT